MSLTLDHVVVAVHDLDQAVQDYRELGFTVLPGGVHANRATYNALVVFEDGTYLELLARTGTPPEPNLIDFSALVAEREGLVGFALRSGDLDHDAAAMRSRGIEVGAITAGERRRGDGTLVQWKLALIDGGFAPFLIEDVTPHTLRVPDDTAITTHANHCEGIRAIRLDAAELEQTIDRYARILDIQPPDLHEEQVSPFALGAAQLLISQQDQANDSGVTLEAIALNPETADDLEFPLDRTHGVRFR